MKYILSVEQMRKIDNIAINEFNISGNLLMENAAHSATNIILGIFDEYDLINPNIDFLCGSGNNGGDGFAIARHLANYYKNIRVFWIGSIEKMSDETKNNFLALEKIGIELIHIDSNNELELIDFSQDCIIDAMIGVGGSENIRGIAKDILDKLIEYNSLKIAIDAPTGLNTNTGNVYENCFEADYTITMYAIKKGMLLNDGPDVCGEIYEAFLGIPQYLSEDYVNNFFMEDEDIQYLLPIRKSRTSKFDYGRILVIAGSDRFPGAAALVSNAAVKAGAGLVQLYSTKFHSSILPEVICVPLSKKGDLIDIDNSLKIIKNDMQKANTIAIGPGIGDNEHQLNFIKELLKIIPENIKVILDADALKVIDENYKLSKNYILTPHSGEFSKITAIKREIIEKQPDTLVYEWSKKLNCNILLKTRPVIISNGEENFWNLIGNSGMATGGSGDVLTGIIAGLAAQGLDVFTASFLGAYLHAKAGDLYLEDNNEYTLSASNLIEYLPKAINNK